MKPSVVILSSLFAINSAAVAFDPALAAPTPTPSPLVEVYGHPQGEPKIKLTWSVYMPAGSPPWPAVLVIHAGGFKTGSRNDADVVVCAHDLADAGFLALAINYRLAPPGHIEGQRQYGDDGRYPKQTADVRTAIRAARTDARCNGKIFAVGGSAGAAHSLWWCSNGIAGDDKLDGAVLLSGPYDLDNAASLAIACNPWVTCFKESVENYVNTSPRDPDYDAKLIAASSITYVTSSVSPVSFFATDHDPIPPQQLPELVTKLQLKNAVEWQSQIITGLPKDSHGYTPHAFAYWETVRNQAIAFLNAN